MKNIDQNVVKDFGEEWNAYKQSDISRKDLEKAWNQYFKIFPFKDLEANAVGFDMGCGSGRWAIFTAEKVGHLNCIDPSEKALKVAQQNLSPYKNVSFYNASVSDDVLNESSQDFGYCLGVLHHIPDTLDGLKSCCRALKRGAPFLLYLYYDLENKPLLFKLIWRLSNTLRFLISKLPSRLKRYITFCIAVIIYYPLARLALLISKFGFNPSFIPLSDYKDKKFKFMVTDALDRFGTRLEKRFSKEQIISMLDIAGFENISFSEAEPYWVCLSYKS
jgi:ubiquinone/menaquinone biosynthesis C-methylase UbiE